MGNTENKLEEAQYFLDQMSSHSGGNKEFMFKLSAFLTASRSIMDVLYYDYGIKFGLLTMNEKVLPHDFQRRAQSNSVATNFYNWWLQKIGTLKADPVCGFLFTKRNIVAHRGHPTMAWSLILAETISFNSGLVPNTPSSPAGSATPNAIDVTTQTRAFGSSTPQPASLPPTASAPRSSLTGYFADHTSDSVVDLCEKHLQVLRSIVTEARTAFP